MKAPPTKTFEMLTEIVLAGGGVLLALVESECFEMRTPEQEVPRWQRDTVFEHAEGTRKALCINTNGDAWNKRCRNLI